MPPQTTRISVREWEDAGEETEAARRERAQVAETLRACLEEVDAVTAEVARLRASVRRLEAQNQRLTHELDEANARLAEKDESEAVHAENNRKLQSQLAELRSRAASLRAGAPSERLAGSPLASSNGEAERALAKEREKYRALVQQYHTLDGFYRELLEFVEAGRQHQQEQTQR